MQTRYMLFVAANLGLLAYSQAALGQSKIAGVVSYNKATPLADVAIAIDGSYDGTTSATDGSFSFETSERGPLVLIAKREGYQDIIQAIVVKDSTTTLQLDLVFTAKAVGLHEVVVRSKALSDDDKIKTLSFKTLDVLTTATDGSVVTALKTLPGAQQVGESSDLFVRGGTGAESKIFIDGLLVNNFNYSSPANQASRSRFPAGLFKGAYFSSGGYSALYGQALSATLLLESEDFPAKSSADFGVSPLSIEGGFQALSKEKNSLIGASLKYTDLSLVFSLLKPSKDFYTPPKYLDGSFFFRKKIAETGLLKFFSSVSKSNLGLRQPDVNYPLLTDQLGLRNANLYTNLTYTQQLKGWKWYLGTAYSRNADQLSLALKHEQDAVYDSLGHDNTELLQFKTVLSRRVLYNGRLQWGGEFIRSSEGLSTTRTELGQIQDNYSAGFAEVESYFTDKLSGRVGVRLENSTLLHRSNLAPRASLNYAFDNKGLLTFSYGIFYQKPEKYYLLASPTLTYTQASHYILSYQKTSAYYTIRTELFYKKYDDLVKTVPALTNNGYGYAQGAEVLWRDKKTLPKIDYWVAYSFLNTKRDFLNYPFAVQPSFAATHTVSVVAKKYFSTLRTSFSASYMFATGRPYFNPNQPADKFMQDRTIAYNNLSLGLYYLPKIGKSFSVVALTVSNILGNEQVYGYTYSNLDPAYRLPITPTNNPFVFLGLFMNFGIDRTNAIIDKSL